MEKDAKKRGSTDLDLGGLPDPTDPISMMTMGALSMPEPDEIPDMSWGTCVIIIVVFVVFAVALFVVIGVGGMMAGVPGMIVASVVFLWVSYKILDFFLAK